LFLEFAWLELESDLDDVERRNDEPVWRKQVRKKEALGWAKNVEYVPRYETGYCACSHYLKLGALLQASQYEARPQQDDQEAYLIFETLWVGGRHKRRLRPRSGLARRCYKVVTVRVVFILLMR
jgi:hypothetical protein